VDLKELAASWKAILVAYLAVTLGRALIIAAVTAIMRRTRERIPWSWAAVLTWGGLKGGLSMVLVLGLPVDFPHRSLLITMTFGVVVLSILVQGVTMSPLLRRLGVVGMKADRREYEVHLGDLRAANAALSEIDDMRREQSVHGDVLTELREEYKAKAERTEALIQGLHREKSLLRAEELYRARRQLLLAEKDQIIKSFHEGIIGADAYDELLVRVDADLQRLEEHGEVPSQEL